MAALQPGPDHTRREVPLCPLCGRAISPDEGDVHTRCAEWEQMLSDRYDAAHPESEHDGGLGSGDWMGPWEDR